MALGDTSIAKLAVNAGFRGSDVSVAVAVALAESGGNPVAVSLPNRNGTTDYGLWQINSVHGFPTTQLLDPQGNANAAYTVWKGSGWNAWTTYKSGKYMDFINRGIAAANTVGVPSGPPGQSIVPASDVPSSDSANATFSNATKPGTWFRVGAFILGTMLIAEGALRAMGVDKTIVHIAKVAAVA